MLIIETYREIDGFWRERLYQDDVDMNSILLFLLALVETSRWKSILSHSTETLVGTLLTKNVCPEHGFVVVVWHEDLLYI